MERLLSDDLQSNPNRGEHRNRRSSKILLGGVAYFPKSKSFIIQAFIGKVRVFIKTKNILTKRSILENSCMLAKTRYETKPLNPIMFEKFGEESILTFHSDEPPRTSYLRPLALVDSKTLKETKIERVIGDERHQLSFSRKEFHDGLQITHLSESRMLMIRKFIFSILDFKVGKVITECQYCFQGEEREKFVHTENLYGMEDSNLIHLLKTKRNEKGKREVDCLKLIDLYDNLRNISLSFHLDGFSLLNLSSGNYLYVTAKKIEEDLGRWNQEGVRSSAFLKISVELSSETLDVTAVKTTRDEEAESNIDITKIRQINGLLLFVSSWGKPKKNFLTLATTGFEILDQCSESHPVDHMPSILAVSSNRVASLGKKIFSISMR